MRFNEEAGLKPYIGINTNIRAEAKKSFSD